MNDQGCSSIVKLVIVFLLIHENHGRELVRYNSYDAYYCTIKINGGLAEPQPLLLCPHFGQAKILYPREAESYGFDIPIGQFFRIACPGSKLAKIRGHVNDSNVICVGENYFLIEDADVERRFNKIACEKNPVYEERKLDKRCGAGYIYEIGFPLKHVQGPDEFVPIIELCHNEKLGHTIYAHAFMPASIDAAQRSFPRTAFRKGRFFPGIPIHDVYTREYQRENLAEILGSKSLASKYIPETGTFYFARGHLIAKADFVYGSEQRATFYYANVVPMWQVINAGNWKTMEENVRRYVAVRNLDFDIWVGSLRVLTLPDQNGREREIYLHTEDGENRVPVPRILFKVLYNKETDAGVVLLTANNPFLRRLTKKYQICEDVCHKVQFLTWKPKNGTLGLSYCCEIWAFRKAFPDFPLNYGFNLLM